MKKYLYFVRAIQTSAIKIGVSNDMCRRMLDLRCSNASELEVLGVIENPSAKAEVAIHKHFADDRLRGEWYNTTPELLNFIARHTQPWQDQESEVVERDKVVNAAEWEEAVLEPNQKRFPWYAFGHFSKRYTY